MGICRVSIYPLSFSFGSFRVKFRSPCLTECLSLSLSPSLSLSCTLFQGSEAEDRMEKEGGVSDSESKPDSGVPDVPTTSDDTPEVLNKALSGLSSR